MTEKLHILVSLLAAIVATVFYLYRGLDPTFIALRLIYIIGIFYFIGILFKIQIKRILADKKRIELEDDTDLSL